MADCWYCGHNEPGHAFNDGSCAIEVRAIGGGWRLCSCPRYVPDTAAST